MIRIRITVLDRAGVVLRRAKARAKLRRYQPNGPNCPPTCYSVGLRYRGDTGRLEVFRR